MPEGLSHDEEFEPTLLAQWRPIQGADFAADGGGGGEGGGDAGGDTGDADGGGIGGGAEGGEEGSGQPDVRQAIDNLSERMETFMQSVQTQQEDPLDFLGDEWDDEDYEDEGQQDFDEGDQGDGNADDLVRSADQIVENLVEQKVQERLAPHLAAQYEEKRHGEVVALESKYPELQEQDNATPLLQTAVQLARALGEPELAYEAPFLETVHLRMKAEAARAEETSGEGGQEREAPIEGAGGSNTGGGSGDRAAEAAKLIAAQSKNRGIF